MTSEDYIDRFFSSSKKTQPFHPEEQAGLITRKGNVPKPKTLDDTLIGTISAEEDGSIRLPKEMITPDIYIKFKPLSEQSNSRQSYSVYKKA